MDTTSGSEADDGSDFEHEVVIRRDMIDPEIDDIGHKSRATYLIYEPKQRQFKAFCASMAYADGDHVTEEKLYQFLNEEVLTQPLTRVRDPDNNTPSYNYARQYVSAIRELWQHQKAEGMVSRNAPEPNGPSVKALMRSLMQRNPPPRRIAYTDWELLTFLDKYRVPRDQMVSHWRSTIEPERKLRTMLDFVLSRKMMVSGHSTRQALLSDLFAVELPSEGSTPCFALVFLLLNGQANKSGLNEFSGAMRNRDVLSCPFAMLGLSLFYRYHIQGEDPPDFGSDQYKTVRLLRTRHSNTRVVPHQQQYDSVTSMFPSNDLADYKKSYFGRGPGAREANLAIMNEPQLAAGPFNAEQQASWFVGSLPRIMMRSQAGFEMAIGSYTIRRAMFDPPDDLLAEIFPWVDDWLEREGQPAPELELSAFRTLRLLKLLRRFIIQDAVLLRRKFPSHPVFNHDIFRSQDYRTYEFMLGHVCDRFDDLEELRDLKRSYQTLKTRLTALEVDVGVQCREINDALKTLKNKFPNELSEVLSNDGEVPRYHFCRTHTTVRELWAEWHTGINGSPSIQSLDERYGSKWRRTASDRQFYSRRNAIIKEVRRLATETYHNDVDAAIDRLDAVRTDLQSKTLHSLATLLLHQSRGQREADRVAARDRRNAPDEPEA
ncbi:transcriptional activator of glycolytic enzymes-domain-containing protein [Dipodascopsis tothii]|uniref:transcriptional activator of glycolytic enzymes-domain-containing protein n=1 Tax=Dipodascopsis tothii TaxID=44089 RepID=UPI0034CD3175